MTDRARSHHSGITTSQEEVEDAPNAVLVSASSDADLVVLGSYGSGAGYTVGSVGQEVAAEAHGPVVLVRGSKPDEGGRVVVGLDIRPPARNCSPSPSTSPHGAPYPSMSCTPGA